MAIKVICDAQQHKNGKEEVLAVFNLRAASGSKRDTCEAHAWQEIKQLMIHSGGVYQDEEVTISNLR